MTAVPIYRDRVFENKLECLRVDLYSLLAFLFNQPPSAETLALLAEMAPEPDTPDDLLNHLIDVRDAAEKYTAESVDREFHDLFIGLGRGEIVPYASWYIEKRLMAAPLARLRNDLTEFRIHRRPDAKEPEDHAAALCETMAMILQDKKFSRTNRATFFRNHLSVWMPRFFRDVRQARSAGFYRFVGALGERFMRAEEANMR